ncbi:peptide ABC transporter ATPase [Corynebacterium suranareeae]|uniref:Peptide ABC transporter ATPase n=1 Tax=Corynebacterium suranareeae TaxID=2506452 RepID=A0A160PQ16_9CORY|nr:ABC transporter ATP-binding protein [Corynebacterium suranareeae]BAU94771.1 peptide ABC transporter ATPase [Corynebacterium suranareeae]
MNSVLEVRNLSVTYGSATVVKNLSFSLEAGESLAIIGESGSGKSTTARALLRLLTTNAVVEGEVFDATGRDLLGVTERQFRSLRGRTIGFIPQDPGNAFNPVRTIGSQAHEAAALLPHLTKEEQKEKILSTFSDVGLPDPLRVYNSYPHELSGGMLQRALIGITILPKPEVIIADEPTSALDVTVSRRILDLLSEMQSRTHIALILITHDLAIAAERTDSVVVLKDGQIQETGRTSEIFANPASAYTRKLQESVPTLNPDRYKADREIRNSVITKAIEPAVSIENISKSFNVGGKSFQAVQDVSIKVARGTTHAIVGESGSGKTTVIRTLLKLEEADIGEIYLEGVRIDSLDHRKLKNIYRDLQLVYQNPFTSLDPTWSVERIIREPLDRFAIVPRSQRREVVNEALESVGLSAELLARKPNQLSGGQRQRVAIARALVLHPKILVLDEPTSALDVSIQAEIFDVLFALQRKLGLTYIFVSHDLSLVRQVADTVTVMQRGRVVEEGLVHEVFENPQDKYTAALIDAIPLGQRFTEEKSPVFSH